MDKEGQPCNHSERPWLSEQCKCAIHEAILQGKDNPTILEENRHRVAYPIQVQYNLPTIKAAMEVIEDPESEIQIPRDYRLNNNDITWMRSQLARNTWKLDDDDAQSVRLLVARERENVVAYQEQCSASDKPFFVCLQSQWQRDMMIKYGHGCAILMDATAGANNCKVRLCKMNDANLRASTDVAMHDGVASLGPQFPLFTLMVMDEHQNGIPVAWVISESQTGDSIAQWLKAIVAAVRVQDPDWKPSCFLVDNCEAEHNGIR